MRKQMITCYTFKKLYYKISQTGENKIMFLLINLLTQLCNMVLPTSVAHIFFVSLYDNNFVILFSLEKTQR